MKNHVLASSATRVGRSTNPGLRRGCAFFGARLAIVPSDTVVNGCIRTRRNGERPHSGASSATIRGAFLTKSRSESPSVAWCHAQKPNVSTRRLIKSPLLYQLSYRLEVRKLATHVTFCPADDDTHQARVRHRSFGGDLPGQC